MAFYEIVVQPSGKRGRCRNDQSLLAAMHDLGVDVASVCGGSGTCHSCKVQVVRGAISPPTVNEQETFSSEELDAGWRLACQAYPAGDCELDVPPESMATPHRIRTDGFEVTVEPDPTVRTYRVRLAVPDLSDLGADADRLLDALNEQHGLCCELVDIEVTRFLSSRLRAWDWECEAAVRKNEVVAVNRSPSRRLGLAIDLGTTKIAGYLVDLNSGETLARRGMMNPQISYGEDVISRITTVMNTADGGDRLRNLATDAINGLAADLCTEVGADVAQVVDTVVVGNTAMHHLCLGLQVKQLAFSPFVPAVSGAMDVKARDLGIRIAPGAYVHLLPNIAGYVGADHVAALLATEPWRFDAPVLVIDIGTNTEVSLAANGELSSVSCASGPAFEGGHITDGMRAAPGAVERVQIEDDSVLCRTVDDAPATGICGSGLLDAVAQLHGAGIIDASGRMHNRHPRLRARNEQREFVLVSEDERDGRAAIVVTQQDVREVQLAKAAVRTGIQVLLDTGGFAEQEIRHVLVAGAFGTYIDVSSAIAIGMLPALPLERFRQVGNAAGVGARLALISRAKRAQAQTIARRVRYIELSASPRFQETFVQAMQFGPQEKQSTDREEPSVRSG